ncbi:flagellar assembly protein FliH [Brachyspira pilosicoli]|uniref:Flagellar assembly protein FliH n=5 Tax=Brachyspira pilosicoli TaxID=52584 RepID=D8IFY9_BRAP9|nr:flagellar assembly protein FliH [Brachyspira pilosicoli]ADK32053.1 flagellar assembly protein, FliH [Brachyspira pilosicoli 95/1000]AFR71081.1 flagellar assembly protein FliH [Brachyspira pilosicoli B2904]AGA66219.1 flagellar assembly protein H [Brachyspira pilosicoli P43/6/78]MBW5377355.1 flagellar assembly protein FliH [Brachyspira pilosicoli]MBW5383941.1 flagellar assembly protein FliH [Brachyspira pilosicoli]
MPEKVFKAKSIVELTQKVNIAVPHHKLQEEIDFEEQEEYHGPSIEEIEAEIAGLRAQWEEDLKDMRRKAADEAQRIIEDAKNQAFEIFKAKQNEVHIMSEQAKVDASRIIQDANAEKERIQNESESIKEAAYKEGYAKGYDEGFEKSFADGNNDLTKLNEKLKKILAETINKRNEIIDTAEAQLIEVAILIAKRVVKMLTEKDKGIVIRNIQEALRRIKGRTKITIRVNIDDLEISARHKDEFYQMLDKIEGVTVLEDPNVDVGGCMIETDFGDIDARINTQLNEIETAIKEVEPIKGF